MPGSQRDDFSATTKKTVAARAGYRCSNPTCRRSTSRPDPFNEAGHVNIGVACHITAASPGGPRYDASITSDDRSSPSNALWLCQVCAKVIDSAPEAFPSQALAAWKRNAESLAAKEARETGDRLGILIDSIDALCDDLTTHWKEWQRREPDITDRSIGFDELGRQIILTSRERTNEYHERIAPKVAMILLESESILGPENEAHQKLTRVANYAWTNYFTLRECASSLHQLKRTLTLY